ncbi:MAG TPA: hypothetical protein VFE98_10880 [Candidatus Bathyarchaeia archaeon]|nr:hypothetical protein [Candidatus Bathyarchaeia archaeon]
MSNRNVIPAQNRELSETKSLVSKSRREIPTISLAQIAAFSALVAVGTLLSNILLLGYPLPPPLYEITVAPAFYMAIAVLFSRRISFWSTAIGSGVGEAAGIFLFGLVPGAFALTYVPGIILARAPEALIINRFRAKTVRLVVLGMVIATVFESVVFFLIDWPVYSFTAFYCTTSPCGSSGLAGGLYLAAFDFGTLLDLVWIPIALALVVAARRAFKIQFFS